MKVDGKIEGSPLYASGVTITGGTHNVLYIATMHNTIYAFDADRGTSRTLGVSTQERPILRGYDGIHRLAGGTGKLTSIHTPGDNILQPRLIGGCSPH